MGQQGVVWTRTAKDRERWRTLEEATSCSGRTQPRIEWCKFYVASFMGVWEIVDRIYQGKRGLNVALPCVVLSSFCTPHM